MNTSYTETQIIQEGINNPLSEDEARRLLRRMFKILPKLSTLTEDERNREVERIIAKRNWKNDRR